jgi:hypothetical protein
MEEAEFEVKGSARGTLQLTAPSLREVPTPTHGDGYRDTSAQFRREITAQAIEPVPETSAITSSNVLVPMGGLIQAFLGTGVAAQILAMIVTEL